MKNCISVEVGRNEITENVSDLGIGSIIELDKKASEPADIFVNGKLIARGAIVVIEENFGIRITELLN